MKKVLGMTLALSLLLGGLIGCASGGGTSAQAPADSTQRKAPGGVPDFVKKALLSAPEDALVGIGTAKLASVSQSMTLAQTRARADIARQLNTMIKDMVNDYTASSEVDTSAAISFQETCTQALAKATLTGASVVEMDTDDKGAYWVVVSMGKSKAAEEINQAAAAAKLKAPALASFDAQARMDKAFDKIASEVPQIVSQ
ncbi:MAG: LPP20 family lipoprotein [Spirochaetaceae bacterium]|jgi:hypothetical protein|nr:LPP20 family lipoprotein [Spirochaetaceae bacterium]